MPMQRLAKVFLICLSLFCIIRSASSDVTLDPTHVRHFLDQVFGSSSGYARRIGVHGATAAVFQRDGAIIAQGGWKPDGGLNSTSTIFCACEISKIITATAAMLAVEQGDLNLTANVNDYFPSQIVPDVIVGRDGDNFVGQPKTAALGPVTPFYLFTQSAGLGNYSRVLLC